MKTREIKFRVWDNVDYMLRPFTLTELKEGRITFTDDCIVMQFTGLKDKNGVDIYEDDYLVDRYPIDDEDLSLGYNESLLPVVWCKDTLSWCIDASFNKDGGFLTSLVEYFGEFLEVKGNIHENKNLL